MKDRTGQAPWYQKTRLGLRLRALSDKTGNEASFGEWHPFRLNIAIDKAKDIEKATQIWADGLETNAKWLVFLVALFPMVSLMVLSNIYRQVAHRLGFTADDVSHLLKKTSSYITDLKRPRFAHPSFREAIIALLRAEYEQQVAEVADLGLAEVVASDVFALSRCAAADYGWLRYPPGETVNIRTYLGKFMTAYNALRNKVFATLKPRLAPYNQTDASCLFLMYSDNSGGQILIVAAADGKQGIYVEQPQDGAKRRDEIVNQAHQRMCHQTVYTVTSQDLVRRSPQMHALSVMQHELEEIFEHQRLEEAWPLAYARLEKCLSDSDWKMLGLQVNPDHSFDTNKMIALFNQFEAARSSLSAVNYHPIIWQNLQRRIAYLPLTIIKCLETLEKSGKKYTGRLLPQHDLEFTATTHTFTSLYSASQMERLIRRKWELKQEAYQQMIDSNFASLKHQIKDLSRYPIHAVVAVSYNGGSFGARSKYIYLPNTFQTLTGDDLELYVSFSQGGDEYNAPAFPVEVERRLKEVEEGQEWYTISEGGLDNFNDLKVFVDSLYKSIKKDINQAMDWDEVGRERSQHFSELSSQFAAANPGKSLAMDFTLHHDAFDWPSL